MHPDIIQLPREHGQSARSRTAGEVSQRAPSEPAGELWQKDHI